MSGESGTPLRFCMIEQRAGGREGKERGMEGERMEVGR